MGHGHNSCYSFKVAKWSQTTNSAALAISGRRASEVRLQSGQTRRRSSQKPFTPQPHFSRPFETDLFSCCFEESLCTAFFTIAYSLATSSLSISLIPSGLISTIPDPNSTISNHIWQYGNGLLVCWLSNLIYLYWSVLRLTGRPLLVLSTR